MRYFDISLPLHEGLAAWPGDTKFQRRESRGTAIVSKLLMSSHTGTHIDAPRHFLFNNQGVDKIALQKLIGKCRVIEIKSPPVSPHSPPARGGVRGGGRRDERPKRDNQISVSDLKKFRIKAGDRILFKTSNSKLLKLKKFISDYVSLSLEAAKYLANKKISLVGIDYFGIEAKSAPGHPVHKALLGAGIVIVEGLDLSKVKPGVYHLAALPLKILGGDGSPARVILWR
mgnify:CR=1 FL=1